MRIIKLDDIQENTKKFYEVCSDMSILQRELDEMLVAIEKNSSDFQKGKISKDLFSHNEDRMKKESANIIKKVNNLIDSGVSFLDKVNKEIEAQKIVEEEKKDKKKDRIKEIKKINTRKTKKKKARPKKKTKRAKKVTPVEKPTEAPQTPEQKIEVGS